MSRNNLLVRDFTDDRHRYRDHESQARRVQIWRCPRDIADADRIGRQKAVIILHLRYNVLFIR